MIGKSILHYKILDKLGEGGMGVVYKVEDTKLKREVAIKFLPHHISVNEEERKRFEIEAQAAACLNHPNITTIHSIEEVDTLQAGKDAFIVMEYIDGVELKDKINTGPIPIEEAINLAVQIAEGLEAAHKKGIIHRDIKSQNIMIINEGKVKIMDFGLAKIGEGFQLTKEGSTIGTAAYMSPEQARGEDVDHRTDIWSLGVVLYEMLKGKLPFKRDYDQAVIHAILNEEPKSVDNISSELNSIINKALSKNPDNRYQTAVELADDLYKIGEGKRIKTVVKKSKLHWMIAAAIALLITVLAYLFIPSSENIQEKDVVKTIAVLPFVNLSPDPGQEYFSDGLAEELLNILAKNQRLRVTSRTSAFSFKGKNVDIKTIGKKLNVKHILEGSVRKSGNMFRIAVQLIDVDTDAHLWSDTYEGTLENIFAVQGTISRSVAEALRLTLLGKETAALPKETDPEAYNAYLLGNHFFNLWGQEDIIKENLEKAIAYYHQAVTIDPEYAAAWVGLSKTHVRQAHYAYVSKDENYRKAHQEVEKALELDPKLADAYSTMGSIKHLWNWDWNEANKFYQQALEFEPGNASILRGASMLASTLGRFEEAISLTRRSIELDPVSVFGYSYLGFFTYYAGLLDESETAYRKGLELDPQHTYMYCYMGRVYLEKGKPDSALTQVTKEMDPQWQLSGLALVYHALGRKKEADDKLKSFIKGYQNNWAYLIVDIYAYRGETDKAFEWLERAYDQRDPGLTEMKGNPLLRNIEKDPRYKAFLKKMKLPL